MGGRKGGRRSCRRVAASSAAKIAQFTGQSVANLEGAIAALENTAWLGRGRLETRSETRAALTVAIAQEALEISAFA